MNAVPKPKDTPKPVAIWIRVSTEDQARGESPEHHERRAHAYAEAKGWKVKEVYHLEGVSGKSVIEHPEAQRMLKDIWSGHITGLVFSKLARLARNTKELLELSDIFVSTERTSSLSRSRSTPVHPLDACFSPWSQPWPSGSGKKLQRE